MEAIDLLLWLSGPAGRGGVRGMWAWISVAGTVARSERSRALAVAVLAIAARLVGREPLYFRLLGGQEAPGELPGGFGLLVDRFLTLGADDEGLAALRSDLLETVFLYDPDLLPRARLADDEVEAGAPSAPGRPLSCARGRDREGAGGAPALRSHRPRPWQIPASIEAQRRPVQPVLPRELFARLPEPMRRSVVWLEAQQRRAAVERRRATPQQAVDSGDRGIDRSVSA